MSFFKKLFGSDKPKKVDHVFEFDKEDIRGVRDSHYRSKAFFQRQIDKCQSDIQHAKRLLKETLEKKGDDFDPYMFFYGFSADITSLISAKYSQGIAVEEILPDCVPLMETTSRIWMKEGDSSDGSNTNFIRLINAICLGILGDVDKQYFKELSIVMLEKKFSDLYVDLLVQSVITEHPIGDKLIVADHVPFKLLVEVLREPDKERAEQLLAKFLEKNYYTRTNLENKYNIHEFEGGRVYYGYWCWEAAAIVKIKGLDDSLFRTNRYYPADFVHYKD